MFTPTAGVEKTLDDLVVISVDAFTKPTNTFCDTMCGDGQFLYSVLKRKIAAGTPPEIALKTIYGVELMQDSAELCRQRLLSLAGDTEENRVTVNKNIVCFDTFKYDYTFSETVFEQLFEEA